MTVTNFAKWLKTIPGKTGKTENNHLPTAQNTPFSEGEGGIGKTVGRVGWQNTEVEAKASEVLATAPAVVAPAPDTAKPLPPFHIAQPWREADKAYQAHYWNCAVCKAGGRTRGPLCPTGAELHQQYEQAAMATEGTSK